MLRRGKAHRIVKVCLYASYPAGVCWSWSGSSSHQRLPLYGLYLKRLPYSFDLAMQPFVGWLAKLSPYRLGDWRLRLR